jgi:hypothetical protein
MGREGSLLAVPHAWAGDRQHRRPHRRRLEAGRVCLYTRRAAEEGMPDPGLRRADTAALVGRLEAIGLDPS